MIWRENRGVSRRWLSPRHPLFKAGGR